MKIMEVDKPRQTHHRSHHCVDHMWTNRSEESTGHQFRADKNVCWAHQIHQVYEVLCNTLQTNFGWVKISCPFLLSMGEFAIWNDWESKCPRALYNMIIYDIKRISTHPLFLMASACLYRDGTACITVQRTKHLSVRFRMLQQRTGITSAVQLA